MKKVITVLAILVVLTSAIFAETESAQTAAGSTNKIKITSTVLRQDPTFSLKGTNGNNVTVTSADGEEKELAVGDISQDDITVTFGIYQTADAKNRFGYSFQVGFTPLTRKLDSENNPVTNGYPVAGTMADPNNANWYVSSTNGIGASVAPSVTDNVLSGSVTFDGDAVVAADAIAKTTFSVTWNSDRLAPAGVYEADVTLTVQTN